MRAYSVAIARRRRREQADLIEGIAQALGAQDLPGLLKSLREG